MFTWNQFVLSSVLLMTLFGVLLFILLGIVEWVWERKVREWDVQVRLDRYVSRRQVNKD